MSYAKDLHVDIKFENYGTELTANCPDEDNDMQITIKNPPVTGSAYAMFNMTLDRAQELGEFLIEHVKNARKQ